MLITLGNVRKVRLTLSRGGKRTNKIISPLQDRDGGMWDLAEEEREGEGATYPGNYKKKTLRRPSQTSSTVSYPH